MPGKRGDGTRSCARLLLCLIAGALACAGAFVVLWTLLTSHQRSCKQTVWITEAGGSYHLRECHVLRRAAPIETSLRRAREKGLSPCSICKPPAGPFC
jgi:hypothetical protein